MKPTPKNLKPKSNFITSSNQEEVAVQEAAPVVKVELVKEVATKYEPLKAIVVTYKNMTWLATESKDPKIGGKLWRCTTNPQRLFAKIDSITSDAALDAPTRDKKLAEAYKSLTIPQPKIPFDWKLEGSGSVPAQTKPLEGAETPPAA
jgi:hypothetical protein